MDSEVFWLIAIIIALVLANGFFALAEIAILAAKRGRLESLANSGDRGAKLALQLADQPEQFLPTVQVGITLVGTIAGVFGGDRFTEKLKVWIAKLPLPLPTNSSPALALLCFVNCGVHVGVLNKKTSTLQSLVARLGINPRLTRFHQQNTIDRALRVIKALARDNPDLKTFKIETTDDGRARFLAINPRKREDGDPGVLARSSIWQARSRKPVKRPVILKRTPAEDASANRAERKPTTLMTEDEKREWLSWSETEWLARR